MNSVQYCIISLAMGEPRHRHHETVMGKTQGDVLVLRSASARLERGCSVLGRLSLLRSAQRRRGVRADRLLPPRQLLAPKRAGAGASSSRAPA